MKEVVEAEFPNNIVALRVSWTATDTRKTNSSNVVTNATNTRVNYIFWSEQSASVCEWVHSCPDQLTETFCSTSNKPYR